jgi:ribosome-associated heat shock protein Hsp15
VPAKEPPSGQRIDKWLWYTRLFKSRSLAAKFVERGKIRLSHNERRERLTKASHPVKVGEVLTFSLHDRIRIIQVAGTGTRRGPASEAQELYVDLSPPKESREEKQTSDLTKTPSREKGMGRPTKRDRRALDRLQDTSD